MAAAAGGPQKLSGMQKQVLGLYRAFLRAARSKAPDERRSIESVVSAEFRRHANSVDRKNFLYIEYLLRRGNKQLDQLKSPGTVRLSTHKVKIYHSSFRRKATGHPSFKKPQGHFRQFRSVVVHPSESARDIKCRSDTTVRSRS